MDNFFAEGSLHRSRNIYFHPRLLALFLLCVSTIGWLPATALAQATSSPIEVTGEASVEVADDFEAGRAYYTYFIIDRQTNKRTQVFFSDEPPAGFHTGNQVRVQGVRRPNGLDVDFGSMELLETHPNNIPVDSQTGPTAQAPIATPVTRKVLTLLVDFNDAFVYDFTTPANTPNGATLQQVKDRMFFEPKNVAHFYDIASLGTLTIPSTAPGIIPEEVPVYGPYQVNLNYLAANGGVCSSSTYVNAALNLWEADTGQSRSDYQHHLLIMPNYYDYSPACTFGGQAQLGCGDNCWAVTLDPQSIMHGVIIHEVGHNFDFNHARFDTNNDGVSDCEYCDESDFMGGSRNWMKFNPPHFEFKGWYDQTSYELRSITPTSTLQTFDLIPVDEEDTGWPGLRAIKTARTTGASNWYLSYRQQTGHYNNVTASYTTGVSLHWRNSTSYSYFYRLIEPGDIFVDTTAGLIVRGIGPMTIDNVDFTDTTQVFTVEICNLTCSTLFAPVNLAAKAPYPDTISLTWEDYAYNEDGFTIEYSPDGSSWSTLDTVAADATSYLHFGLSANNTFYYRVRAYRGASEASDWSGTVSATTPPASGVIGFPILTGNDDGIEFISNGREGNMWLTAPYTYLGFDLTNNADNDEGLRFQNVTIPQGAVINSAYINYRAYGSGTGSTAVTFRAQDIDDAPEMTNSSYNLTTRAFGAASVNWTLGNWTSGSYYASPELKTVVQPIVNRAGWAGGNSMLFITQGPNTGTHRAYSFDNFGGTSIYRPELVVDYTWTPPGNQPPTAAFTYTTYNRTATFTDTSTDSDGGVVSWLWDFGDAATSTLQNPMHTYLTDATYTVTLTVTDNEADSDNTSQDVTVVQDVTDPVITVLGDDPVLVGLGDVYSSVEDAGATASDNQDGDITADIITSGLPVDTSTTGNKTVTYDVTDGSGNSASASRTVTVQPNQPPVANFSSSPGGLTVNFSDASSDSDGTVVAWSWDFGDASGTSVLQNPSYAYPNYTTYSVTLTVTDNDGDSGFITKDVTLNAACVASKAMIADRWESFSLPCTPPDATVGAVFTAGTSVLTTGGYNSNWVVYIYENTVNAAAGRPQGYSKLGVDSLLEEGKGYFFYTTVNTNIDVAGEDNTGADIPLRTEAVNGIYNLVGNPRNGSVDWTNTQINDGGIIVAWTAFDKAGGGPNPSACEKTVEDVKCLMSWIMLKWEPSAYNAYNGVAPTAGVLNAFDTIWVRAYKAGIQYRIPPPPAAAPLTAASSTALADAAPASNDKTNNAKGGQGGQGGGKKSTAWYVRLVAESGHNRDRGNWIGQADNAQDGPDSRDLLEWAPFSSPYLTILFTNPLFDDVSWGYTTDYRAPTRTPQGEWPFVVRASAGLSEVTLTWEGDASLFDNAQLIDEVSGETITLVAGGSYTFTMNGETHAFRLLIN